MTERHGKRGMPGYFLMVCLLTGSILVLCCSLLWSRTEERRSYQFIADLDGMEYDGSFLEKAGKIRGVCQISPVLEIPIRLKMENYTMDTVIKAVDMEVFDKKVQYAREVPLGNTPVLFLGKDSLAGMRDSNDHSISEKQKKKFLENYADLKVEYAVPSAVSDEQAGEDEHWSSCIVAGIFSSPADGIYLPYSQSSALYGNAERPEVKALLTVRGRDNFEKVQSYFETRSGAE